MHAECIGNSRWDVHVTARHRGQKPEPWIGPGAVPDHRAEGRTGKSHHPRQAVRAQPLSGGQCAAASQTPTNAAERWPGAATLDCSDIAKLREIVATFPTTRELVNSGDLKAVLDVRWRRVRAMQNLGRRCRRAATVREHSELIASSFAPQAQHPHAHDLFQWIITSNRTFLVRLPQGNMIKSIKCRHQFLMKSAAPEKEAKFQALKRRHKVGPFCVLDPSTA